jgi:hypothetical protein
MRIGPRIHRIGSGLVNSYLLDEAGESGPSGGTMPPASPVEDQIVGARVRA